MLRECTGFILASLTRRPQALPLLPQGRSTQIQLGSRARPAAPVDPGGLQHLAGPPALVVPEAPPALVVPEAPEDLAVLEVPSDSSAGSTCRCRCGTNRPSWC